MRTYLTDLPTKVGGFVCENEDGEYTIVLNSKHSRERNQETYWREMEHVEGNDLHATESADSIEYKRHK